MFINFTFIIYFPLFICNFHNVVVLIAVCVVVFVIISLDALLFVFILFSCFLLIILFRLNFNSLYSLHPILIA